MYPVSDLLTVAGLLLDIGGAGILAIPDVHRARIQFVFGRLNEAMEEVQYGKLRKDDIGFQDVARRYVGAYGAGERGIENIEYTTQEPKASPNLDSTDGMDDPGDPETSNTDLVFVKHTEDSVLGGSYHHKKQGFYSLYMPEITRGEERTRTVGIALLIVGFVLQTAATPIRLAAASTE